MTTKKLKTNLTKSCDKAPHTYSSFFLQTKNYFEAQYENNLHYTYFTFTSALKIPTFFITYLFTPIIDSKLTNFRRIGHIL